MKNTDGLDKWKVFSDYLKSSHSSAYICCVHPYDMSQLSAQRDGCQNGVFCLKLTGKFEKEDLCLSILFHSPLADPC